MSDEFEWMNDNVQYREMACGDSIYLIYTVCPGSSDPFYIVS